MKILRNDETVFIETDEVCCNCTSADLSASLGILPEFLTYTYNDENRLIETQNPSSKTQKFSFIINYKYSPFGKTTRRTGDIANRFAFRFSSEYSDTETGLVYYNFRYYSPELGRWLSRDRIGENGGLNLYGMVGNNVVDWWDYLGNRPKSTLCDRTKQAKYAIDNHNPKSIRENIEYCGLICEICIKGKVLVTRTATKGTIDKCNPDSAPCPADWKKVAAWHTHGGFVDKNNDGIDDYYSEQFSGKDEDGDGEPDKGDKGYAEYYGQDIYLGTPSGKCLRYDPSNNSVTNEGTVKTK